MQAIPAAEQQPSQEEAEKDPAKKLDICFYNGRRHFLEVHMPCMFHRPSVYADEYKYKLPQLCQAHLLP